MRNHLSTKAKRKYQRSVKRSQDPNGRRDPCSSREEESRSQDMEREEQGESLPLHEDVERESSRDREESPRRSRYQVSIKETRVEKSTLVSLCPLGIKVVSEDKEKREGEEEYKRV